MEKRFEGTKAVPGTQSYHQFEPISEKQKLLQEHVARIFSINLFMTSMVVEIRNLLVLVFVTMWRAYMMVDSG